MDFAESRLRTAENDCSLTTTEIGPEPSFNVVKIRLSELVEEKRDTNPIECLRDGNNRRAHWEFRLLQTPGDFQDERKKGRRSRALAAESMLMGGWREMLVESGWQKSFQNLHRQT